jgi:UDP-2,3-diacylglucosamine pyrophosphatase LpxH
MVIDGLDILITGHVHKGIITKPQKIVFDTNNKRVSFKDFTVVSSTSWLEFGGYALRKLLIPASNTIQTLLLHRDRKQAEVTW